MLLLCVPVGSTDSEVVIIPCSEADFALRFLPISAQPWQGVVHKFLQTLQLLCKLQGQNVRFGTQGPEVAEKEANARLGIQMKSHLVSILRMCHV